MRDVRDQLVMAALYNVPFDGWSRRTLRAAALDAGYDETMGERAFPGGPIDAVLHLADLGDRRVAAEAEAEGLASLRLSERIAWLVRHRIEAWAEHKESIRRALTLLSLPNNVAAAARATWRTADTLWYAAGDSSADFSYYTKRMTLAAVYSSTLLYWLQDSSEGSAETWGFLRRRLGDTIKLTKLRVRTQQRFQHLPNPMDLFLGRKGSPRRRFGVRG